MNIDIVLFEAWLALQPWRLGRMVFREIQHSSFSPPSSLLITYTRISTCISELEVERRLQPNPLHGKIELKYEEFFFSFPINFASINTDYNYCYSIIDVPNTQMYKYSYKYKQKV